MKMLNLLRKRLNVVEFGKRQIYTPGSRNSQNSLIASNKFFPLDRVNVTILNSNSPLGEATALTLKQNPLVRDLVIHCKSGTIGIYKDLRLIPTSTNLQAYVGFGQLKHALSKADIVLIMGKFEPDEVSSSKEMFKKNLEYTKFMAEAMVQFCPNAIIIMDIYPVNITFPYFAEILSENGVFCANRLLGSVSLHTLRAQSILGQVLGIRPNKVCVDLIGGGTPETLIPVISSSYPGGPAINCVADKIRDKIIKMNSEVFAAAKSVAVLSHAYSLAAFVGKVAEGLTGRENVRANAFIRTTALMGIEFFTMPVGLGIAGIEMNYGIPKLSDTELRLMDQIFPILQSEIEYGISYARPPPPLVEGPETSQAPTCQPIPCEF